MTEEISSMGSWLLRWAERDSSHTEATSTNGASLRMLKTVPGRNEVAHLVTMVGPPGIDTLPMR